MMPVPFLRNFVSLAMNQAHTLSQSLTLACGVTLKNRLLKSAMS